MEQDIKKEKKFTKFHPGTHNTHFEMFRKEAIIQMLSGKKVAMKFRQQKKDFNAKTSLTCLFLPLSCDFCC